MSGTSNRLPPWLPHPVPGELASPAQSRVFDAYCAELGIDPKVARHSFMTFIEATRWWNSGAPELYEGPTRGSEALVHYRAAVAAGVDGGGPEFRAILVRADYQERLDRVMPDPARPGWRAPRSKYAPSAQEREACGNDSDD